MAFVPDKPSHGRFAFRHLNSTQYKTYAHQYSRAKAGGIRCVYSWASGTGVLSVVTDLSKGIVIIIFFNRLIFCWIYRIRTMICS